MGNPDNETVSGEFADTYEREARAAGHEVRRSNIADLFFDPILHKGYKLIQALEPDLIKVQEDMKWADHFVLVYPLWWSSMPALLKGMWDRMFIPGFAFSFNKMTKWYSIPGWQKLLAGKNARLIVLSKTAPWQTDLLFGNPIHPVSKAILGFAGYSVKVTRIGNSEGMSDTAKKSWLDKISSLAKKGQ